MPTLLDLAGVQHPATVRARSLLPVLDGRAREIRPCAVSSWSLKGVSRYRPSVIRNEEWALCFWRSGVAAELYHRPTDPGEERNVIRQEPGAAKRLHREYLKFLEEHSTPAANYWPRRFHLTARRVTRASLLFGEGGS